MGALDDAVAAYNKPEFQRGPAEVSLVYEILSRDGRIKHKDWPNLLSEPAAGERQKLLARLDRMKKAAPPSLPTARGIDEAGGKSPPTYFLKRGEYTARGPAVEPAFPAVIASAVPTIAPTAETTGRRKALAEWLTRADHPLTTRVMVNRLWQGHFGRGLVGAQRLRPDVVARHPELLDGSGPSWSRWSLKAMHRLVSPARPIANRRVRRASADRQPLARPSESPPARRRASGHAVGDGAG
jgi:hypothetical protein